MKFVSTSKSAVVRAVMAHIFLTDAAKDNRLNDISNIDDVLEALDPTKVIDGFIEDAKNNSRY